MTTCPSCAQENPDGFRFCGTCGSALATESAPAREERKVVTVLFCDLVGSTERAERMDPEDVRAMLGQYHEKVRRELERHGGTVEKFIGDAAMALFGAPVAHEDDPERAVRAALAIRAWATETGDLHVRIGVTTGEALVSLGARTARGEGMAAGDVVNTAARLQTAAGIDAVLVDDTTRRATRDRIEYRSAGEVTAKGKAEPIPAWEAIAARSRLGLDVAESAPTPLVGRAREVELLVGAFERTRRDRIGELITLVGEPGIGKSRLVLELFRRVEEQPELVGWRQGRCLPYGEGVTLWALGEIVKAEAGVMETDGAEEAGSKLAEAVRRGIRDEAEASWVEGHLRPLVGIGAETALAGERRDEAFAAWRRFIESVADRRPTILVFEDLHWADDALLDFIDHLVEWAADVPLLVVAISRPELLARRPGWGGGKPNATTRSLAPLTDQETSALVHARLGRALLPAETQQFLIANAGGNPLYAEEFARAVADRGAHTGSQLPETVQGLIAARLDALEPEAKALLQDAAVVGKVFWLDALAAVSGDERWRIERLLHDLERRELVRRDRASAVAGERQYAFRHQLVRDVAYAQIPRGPRAEKHAAAARWIEAIARDRSEDRAEMLAHHWSAAMRYAEAAGRTSPEFAERATAALTDAGDRALSLHAASAAAGFYEQAIDLIGDEPPAQLRLRHGRSLYLAGDDRAGSVLESARDALVASGDAPGAAFADAMLAYVSWLHGDTEEATRHTELALERVRPLPPSEMKAHVLARAASRAHVAHRLTDAVTLALEAIELAEQVGVDDVRIHALATLGSAREALGDLDGVRDQERAYELAIAVGSPEGGRVAHNLGVTHFLLGDVARYRELHAESLRIDEHFGQRAMLRFARGSASSLSYFFGDWDDAMRQADEFIAACALEPHYQERHALAFRAAMRFARDDLDGALADLERAFVGPSDPQSRAPLLGIGAMILTELGDLRAADLVREALDLDFGSTPEPIVTTMAVMGLSPDLRAHLAAVVEAHAASPSRWLAAARRALARDYLGAAEVYAGMPARPIEAFARFRAAETLIAGGRRDEAEAQLDRAVAFWRSVGAKRYLRTTEQLRARIVA